MHHKHIGGADSNRSILASYEGYTGAPGCDGMGGPGDAGLGGGYGRGYDGGGGGCDG